MFVFSPALTFYSTSYHLDWERVKVALILAAFSFFQNILSFFVARCFRRFHKDERLGRVVEVAVGNPNQLALPILVMLSMCKSDIVNADFDGDSDTCGGVAMSFLFIYAVGFYVSFWGLGYGALKKLKTLENPNDRYVSPSGNLKNRSLTILCYLLRSSQVIR